MAFVMPEVALQRLVQIGISNLKNDRAAFNCIFSQFLRADMRSSYGQAYIDKIYNWFVDTKIPVLQAWSFDPTKVPSLTIHLADESEDESKAAIADYLGAGADSEILVGVSSVSLDIGIHADKSKDHVLWLYYILTYILYKEKMTGQDLGLQLYTFRASEYNKESKYMADNVWSRWVRFRCTVENSLDGEEFIEPTIIIDLDASNMMNTEVIDIYEETLSSDVPRDIRRS